MRPCLVILDFDGTFTLIEKEEARFSRMFFEQVRQKACIPQDEMDRLVEEHRRLIRLNPQQYGWINNGHIVAPALVDPYIEMQVVADFIFRAKGTIPDGQARQDEFDSYFARRFASVWTTFKPETEAALLALEQMNPGLNYFVSNSGTKIIQRKLRALKGVDGLRDRVHGGAKKYLVDTGFASVNPATMTIEGLSRPVHLRRPKYFQAICELLARHGLNWEDTVVVGDIAELDLFMPLALGATVALMDHPRVPEYERRFFRSHSRARLLSSPGEIISLLP